MWKFENAEIGVQWRAQLHLHEHQAGLGAHRHAGDGLHSVDPGDDGGEGEKGEEEDRP